jgi:hypothetical protein
MNMRKLDRRRFIKYLGIGAAGFVCICSGRPKSNIWWNEEK